MAIMQSELFAWIMTGPTQQGGVPVGMVFGRPFIQGSLMLGNFTWFPWASKRNIYEAGVNIIEKLRHEVPLVFHVGMSDKRFAEQVARHAIARRVGTLWDLGEEPLAEFQSKQPKTSKG